MHWLSIIGIGLAANLDNLGIGLSFGARTTKIPFGSNLLIAILSMIAAYVSIVCGQFIAQLVTPSITNALGGGLIILIGLWSMRTEAKAPAGNVTSAAPAQFSEVLKDPAKADRDGNNTISWSESWALGAALAINCLASGFGAGVTGVSAWAVSLSIGLFSLLTVAIGTQVGRYIAQSWFGRNMNRMAGLLLVLIGLYEILV